MRTASVGQMAVSLAFILVSCGATRYSVSGPTGPQDLARYVLIIQPQPDGQVIHEWVPLKDFDSRKLQIQVGAIHGNPLISRVSISGDPELEQYCDGRHDQCIRDCTASPTPFIIGWRQHTATKGQSWISVRNRWCGTNCLDVTVECKKRRGPWYAEYSPSFRAIDNAIDWIKDHRKELAVGAVIVIAGVAFAVVAAGSFGGALALAPLLAFADSAQGLPPEKWLAEAGN